MDIHICLEVYDLPIETVTKILSKYGFEGEIIEISDTLHCFCAPINRNFDANDFVYLLRYEGRTNDGSIIQTVLFKRSGDDALKITDELIEGIDNQ